MHDQVVHAHDIVGLHHDLFHVTRDFRVCGLAQQRRDRVARNAKACPHDERCNQHTDIAIHRQSGEPACHHAQDNHGGRDHVVAAVLPRGHKNGRVDAAANLHVKRAHPQLHQHGHRQDHHQHDRKRHRFRVDDAVDRGLEKLKAHQHDDERDHQTRDILGAAVAERVLGVRRLASYLKAHNRDQAGQAVRQVVERVRDDRDRPGQQTDDHLEHKQEHIARNADRAREHAVLLSHTHIVYIIRIADKQANERLCHNNPLEYKML